ncbi:MAG: SIMPL domain-containing protein [Candidatus Pacebacteria bacterium]|nr:SIMPL domain-containing protein [Candidatus Paceibacterota bacterium]
MDSLTKERATKAVLVLAIVLSCYVALLAIAKLREYPYIGSQYPTGNVITVSGEGEVFAVADIAEFGFSVRSDKPTLAEAQQDSAERMNAIIDYLKGQGVDEKDIKTTNYSANPKYEWGESDVMPLNQYDERMMYPYPQPGNQVLVGYEVYQSISVKVRDTDKAGTLVTGVSELGATDFYGPNFTIDDEEELQREARKEAIKDARTKAKQLADDLNVRLVRVVSFSENGGGYYPMYSKVGMGYDMAVAESAPIAPELPMGENSVMANVSITYEIR